QSGTELEWSLLDQNDKPVESGLYAYTLTIRDQTGEGSRVQRGHVIVDRASAADRVWVTSEKAVGIGAGGERSKLTVAGTSETTVGGADVSEATSRSTAERGRSNSDRKAQAKAEGEQSEAAAADGTGTPGQIAKWTSNTTLGDSVIAESAGNVAIGGPVLSGVNFDFRQTNASGDILQRIWNQFGDLIPRPAAGAKLRYVAAVGATSQLQMTDNAEWLMAIAGNNSIGMQFRVRNTTDPNTEAGLAAAARMTILRNGNVGIGTTSPTNARLVVTDSAVGPVVLGQNNANGTGVLGTGGGFGVRGESNNTGIGVRGLGGTGVVGQTSNAIGNGVAGFHTDTTGSSGFRVGVYGSSDHPSLGVGVKGLGSSSGVYGESSNGSGVGVSGFSSAANNGTGVKGQADGDAGSIGVRGQSTNGVGVSGFSTNNIGVTGASGSSDHSGVSGFSQGGDGVYGQSIGGGTGVLGLNNNVSGLGVYGQSDQGIGVKGSSSTGFAMLAGGNAKQSRDKGGWVKAMVRYNNSGTACFRGDENASGSGANSCNDFTIVGKGTGEVTITFPFTVNDRFIVVSTQYGGISDTATAAYEFAASNQIVVRTFRNGQFDNLGFTLAVF